MSEPDRETRAREKDEPPGLPNAPRFSLVLTTLGARPEEMARFLHGLDKQTYRSFELVVVDQSQSGRATSVAAPFADRFPIRLASSARGLSAGRNVGFSAARGAVIGFPDDDCWYHPGVLAEVDLALTAHPEWDGLTAVTRDSAGRLSLSRFEDREDDVTLARVWSQGVEPAMFFRRQLLEAVGPFDEALGVGASSPFQSGEGTELLVRAVRTGHRVRFVPTIHVFHEEPARDVGPAARLRARSYGRGIGRVLRVGSFPASSTARVIGRPLAGAALAGATGRMELARYRWSAFRGRLEGWLAQPRGRD